MHTCDSLLLILKVLDIMPLTSILPIHTLGKCTYLNYVGVITITGIHVSCSHSTTVLPSGFLLCSCCSSESWIVFSHCVLVVLFDLEEWLSLWILWNWCCEEYTAVILWNVLKLGLSDIFLKWGVDYAGMVIDNVFSPVCYIRRPWNALHYWWCWLL